MSLPRTSATEVLHLKSGAHLLISFRAVPGCTWSVVRASVFAAPCRDRSGAARQFFLGAHCFNAVYAVCDNPFPAALPVPFGVGGTGPTLAPVAQGGQGLVSI